MVEHAFDKRRKRLQLPQMKVIMEKFIHNGKAQVNMFKNDMRLFTDKPAINVHSMNRRLKY